MKNQPRYERGVLVEEKNNIWKVYYSAEFCGHERYERCGDEISVDHTFVWLDKEWIIPAIYCCTSGLVIDFCIKAEKISEDSLDVDIRPHVKVNGRDLEWDTSCAVTWNPYCVEGVDQTDAEKVLTHYGCDKRFGWVFLRASFCWATKRKPKISALDIRLEQEPVLIFSKNFTAEKEGQKIKLFNPHNGKTYILTIEKYKKKQLPKEMTIDDEFIFPDFYDELTYILTPDLPDSAVLVRDRENGDSPVQKSTKSKNAVAIGIIGGAYGPVSLFIAGREETDNLHMACSSLRFQPVEQVKWEFFFQEKIYEDIEMSLSFSITDK